LPVASDGQKGPDATTSNPDVVA